jgi:hypothetical protein
MRTRTLHDPRLKEAPYLKVEPLDAPFHHLGGLPGEDAGLPFHIELRTCDDKLPSIHHFGHLFFVIFLVRDAIISPWVIA